MVIYFALSLISKKVGDLDYCYYYFIHIITIDLYFIEFTNYLNLKLHSKRSLHEAFFQLFY